MDTASIVLLAVLVAVGLAWALWGRRRVGTASRPALATLSGRRAVVVLDVGDADRHGPAVDRLVREAAVRTLAMVPDADQVEVRARSGAILGVVSKEPRPLREVAWSEWLFEPHPSRGLAPEVSGHGDSEPFSAPPEGRITAPAAMAAPPHRLVAERFDLPDLVRAPVRDSDDLVDVVRAILEAAAIRAEPRGGLLVTEDAAVVVLDLPMGSPVSPEDLTTRSWRSETWNGPGAWSSPSASSTVTTSAGGRCWPRRSSTPGPRASSGWQTPWPSAPTRYGSRRRPH